MISKRIAQIIYSLFDNEDWVMNDYKYLNTQFSFGEWEVIIEAYLNGVFEKINDPNTGPITSYPKKITSRIDTLKFINESGEVEVFDYEYLSKCIVDRLNEMYK